MLILLTSVILVTLGKGIADIVSDETNWKESIFSKYSIDSFFGCKDYTWIRKYRKNKFWNYIFTTILVFTTDIWHFGNFLTKLGYYLGMIGIIYLDYSFFNKILILLIHLGFNLILFHLFYHKFLRK